jgi:hypothetical protein
MRQRADAAVTAQPLLQMAADFYKWRAVLFAIELDLFTALGANPASERGAATVPTRRTRDAGLLWTR